MEVIKWIGISLLWGVGSVTAFVILQAILGIPLTILFGEAFTTGAPLHIGILGTLVGNGLLTTLMLAILIGIGALFQEARNVK